MKTIRIIPFLLALVLFTGLQHGAAQGTAFTYQGRLNSGTNFATGSFDLTFTLFSVSSGAGQVGVPVTNSVTGVTNGFFTVTLDFGTSAFPGANRWLEIGVRTNGSGAFTTLTPRQRITATPYAITASNVTGVVPSSSVAGTYGSPVTFNNAANNFSGTFNGNGGAVTNLNANNLASGTVPDARLAANIARSNQVWLRAGNLGTTPGTDFVGTRDNQALEIKVNNSRALRLEPNAAGAPNVIGGSAQNLVFAGVVGATISGGEYNTIWPGGSRAAIGGGSNNMTISAFSRIGGGANNTISNLATYATIGGGEANRIHFQGERATIGGGGRNLIRSGSFGATIAGGEQNVIDTAAWATMGGGVNNAIGRGSADATVAGGQNNVIQSNAPDASIGGGYNNIIAADSPYATIAGGAINAIGTNCNSSMIGGGYNNVIADDSSYAIIAGGEINAIGTNSGFSMIGGGRNNVIAARSSYSTIGGGAGNAVGTNSLLSVIGGGWNNSIGLNAQRSTIGGGQDHVIQQGAEWSVIAGGFRNAIHSNLVDAAIGGGSDNVIHTNATSGTIAGGNANQVTGTYGTVPGGDLNVAGLSAFAAGHRAKANHQGAFVWGDSQNSDVHSTSSNQFLIRASGGVGIGATNLTGALFIRQPTGMPTSGMNPADNGLGLGQFATNSYKWIQSYGGSLALNPLGNNVGIGKTNPATALDVNGTVTATAFNPPSDRNLKENFKPVNTRAVLEKVAAMAVSEWNFKEDNTVRHVGPMAQDFHAAFGLGTDERHIATVDADGVALAAIQGLNQKVEEQRAENTELREKNRLLEKRLERLEKLLPTH